MTIKVSNDQHTLVDGLIKRTWSMLDKIEEKAIHNDKGDQ